MNWKCAPPYGSHAWQQPQDWRSFLSLLVMKKETQLSPLLTFFAAIICQSI
jgi:hypothetical protein